MTNVSKSSVAPIRCDNIDLEAALANFPASLVQLPVIYLGLPLSLGRLRCVDFQPYLDKAAQDCRLGLASSSITMVAPWCYSRSDLKIGHKGVEPISSVS
jgi:hypothetical protein